MMAFAADENFNGNLVRGFRQRVPQVSIVTVQEAGLLGASDPEVLEWTAREGLVLLTPRSEHHDLRCL